MERKVYVLSNTDDSKFKYDGGNIIGVFGSLESAKEKVEEVKKEIEKNYSDIIGKILEHTLIDNKKHLMDYN